MIKRKHFKYKFYPPHTLHQHEGVYATNDGIHDSLPGRTDSLENRTISEQPFYVTNSIKIVMFKVRQ